jgi:hypothetical protein
VFREKMVSGTAAILGSVYLRPARPDFDWVCDLGCPVNQTTRGKLRPETRRAHPSSPLRLYCIVACASQYVAAASYCARHRVTPLPPSSLPSAFRIIVMGCTAHEAGAGGRVGGRQPAAAWGRHSDACRAG